MVSAVANGPKTVALYSEKTAEIKTLKIGPLIKVETKNVQVIEALIWTAILTLIVGRRIYTLVRNSTTHPEKNG